MARKILFLISLMCGPFTRNFLPQGRGAISTINSPFFSAKKKIVRKRRKKKKNQRVPLGVKIITTKGRIKTPGDAKMSRLGLTCLDIHRDWVVRVLLSMR